MVLNSPNSLRFTNWSKYLIGDKLSTDWFRIFQYLFKTDLIIIYVSSEKSSTQTYWQNDRKQQKKLYFFMIVKFIQWKSQVFDSRIHLASSCLEIIFITIFGKYQLFFSSFGCFFFVLLGSKLFSHTLAPKLYILFDPCWIG